MSAVPGACTHVHLSEASPWVARFAPLLRQGGRVLDLACGSGRHARYLVARGHLVEAVDRDAEALLALSGSAAITVRHADLEAGAWPYADGMFDGVVVTNYLFRPLLPLIAACLAPGGVLLYETFGRGNESYGRPSNPDFLLAPGELLGVARTAQLRVVAYEDGYTGLPKPAIVQRIAAVRPPAEPAMLPLGGAAD
ncbi:MAG TPA: class I SAM-dependent methyltransferase [Burkholderiales bacterium]|jgi:SAM-dependent methyltransferase